MWHVLDTAAMQEQGETTVSIRGIGTTNTEAPKVQQFVLDLHGKLGPGRSGYG